MTARPIPRQSTGWDERRNTSRVFPVHPDALPQALAALRRIDPALRAWVEAGAPRLTEAEHLERFGAPFGETAAAATRRADTSGGSGDRQQVIG